MLSNFSAGGLVSECLAALNADHLKSDCGTVKRLVELKEEEEEAEEEEAGEEDVDSNDEVFSLELERGETGLGLALVDTRVSTVKKQSCIKHVRGAFKHQFDFFIFNKKCSTFNQKSTILQFLFPFNKKLN